MTTPPTRRLVLRTAIAATAIWAAPQARACEYFTRTLRITHPWTRATPAGASFAMLGMRFDEVTQDEELLVVHTPVAEAVVFVSAQQANQPSSHPAPEVPHSFAPVPIPAGLETVLGQAHAGSTGPHLRLLRLTQHLEIGRSYPLHLTFKEGGTVKTLLTVDYARFF